MPANARTSKLPAYLAKIDLKDPTSEREPILGHPWASYQLAFTGDAQEPEIDFPTPEEIERYHYYFWILGRLQGGEIYSDWLVPIARPDSEPLLSYRCYNRDMREDDAILIPFKDVARFTKKVRYINSKMRGRSRKHWGAI